MTQWQAGFRPLKQNRASSRMSRFLRAIAVVGADRIKVHENPADDPDETNPDAHEPEIGANWVLTVARGKYSFKWNMSRMTVNELEALKNIFMYAYENALPIAQQRDQQAEEAANNGDDLFERRFRSTPHFTVVPRKEQ